MTPKTNRQKVEHIRSFQTQFNVTFNNDREFLLMLARYTNGPELTPEAWQELEELYQHVVSLEEGDECPKKGPNSQGLEMKEGLLSILNRPADLTISEKMAVEDVLKLIKDAKETETQEFIIDDRLIKCDKCGKTFLKSQIWRQPGIEVCAGCVVTMDP